MTPYFILSTSYFILSIGLFEESRTSVSGRGRTGATFDLGETLTGSSDEKLGLMSGMSARPLTMIGHDEVVCFITT